MEDDLEFKVKKQRLFHWEDIVQRIK